MFGARYCFSSCTLGGGGRAELIRFVLWRLRHSELTDVAQTVVAEFHQKIVNEYPDVRIEADFDIETKFLFL